jgi:hypothetical protein
MDPLTIATAVTSAISVASKITSDLIPFLRNASRAPRELALVQTEVRCLSGTLQSVQAHFNPQGGTYTSAQLEQLSRVVSETATTLTSLSAVVERARPRNWVGRVRWTINLTEVDRHRVSLSACTSMLNVLVATLSEYVLSSFFPSKILHARGGGFIFY